MKELFSNSRHDNEIKRDVAELKNRMDAVEHLLDKAKDVLTLEEAAAFMGMKKSTLYKRPTNRLSLIGSLTASLSILRSRNSSHGSDRIKCSRRLRFQRRRNG